MEGNAKTDGKMIFHRCVNETAVSGWSGWVGGWVGANLIILCSDQDWIVPSAVPPPPTR